MKSLDPVLLPSLTTAQMRAVDRVMVDVYGIALIQMMENAGRNLAALARRRFLAGQPAGRRVVVLAGTGGNGGGALVAARHLHTWGAEVVVVTTRNPPQFSPVPARQLRILQQMDVPCVLPEALPALAAADLVIDGIIGYSLQGPPHGPAATCIRWTSQQRAPVLALDVPSGLSATGGPVHELSVHATATMTLALPKQGLFVDDAAERVGELYLADIGVPPALYARPPLGLDVGPLFAENSILRLE